MFYIEDIKVVDANGRKIAKGKVVEQKQTKKNDQNRSLVLDTIESKYKKNCLLGYVANFVSVKTGAKIAYWVSKFNLKINNVLVKG